MRFTLSRYLETHRFDAARGIISSLCFALNNRTGKRAEQLMSLAAAQKVASEGEADMLGA